VRVLAHADGLDALAAAWMASGRSRTGAWLAVWLADAGLALLIGVVAAAVKFAARQDTAALRAGTQVRAGLHLPCGWGAAYGVLFHAGLTAPLPGTWLLLYGASVVSGGGPRSACALDGACFMAAGAAAFCCRRNWATRFWRRGLGGCTLCSRGDCGEVWRLGKTRRGANAKRSRSSLAQ